MNEVREAVHVNWCSCARVACHHSPLLCGSFISELKRAWAYHKVKPGVHIILRTSQKATQPEEKPTHMSFVFAYMV